MAYTTAAEVAAILAPAPSDTSVLAPFIAAANSLVVNVCVPLGYDSDTLTQIETWLSAHFYCISAAQTNEEEADTLRDRFDSKVDLGLKVTRYGQMALVLDYKNGLARLDFAAMGQGKPRPNITWLGKNPRRNPPFGWPWGYPY